MKYKAIIMILMFLLVSVAIVSAQTTTGSFSVTGEAVKDAEEKCSDPDSSDEVLCPEEEEKGFFAFIKKVFKKLFG